MMMQIYIFYYTVLNFFTRPFFHYGQTLVQCIDNTGYNLTVGKIYKSECRDRISYYLIDDSGRYDEISKTKFKLIKKLKRVSNSDAPFSYK